MMRTLCCLILACSAPALGRPANDQTWEDPSDEEVLVDPSEDDEFELDDSPEAPPPTSTDDGDDMRFDEIDDAEMPDFNTAPPPAPKPVPANKPPPRAPAKPTGTATPDATGKTPLADNYPVRIVSTGEDTVVVELPVLLATSPTDVQDSWIIADVLLEGVKLSEVRIWMTKPGMSVFGPTFGYLKAQVPVTHPTGELELVVQRTDGDGKNGAELFRTRAPYELK